MPKTKIDPFTKGYTMGHKKGRNERKEEDIKYGADLCIYSLMDYICDETQMSFEETVKLYDGVAFRMRKVNQGFLPLSGIKEKLLNKYGINMEWDREEKKDG